MKILLNASNIVFKYKTKSNEKKLILIVFYKIKFRFKLKTKKITNLSLDKKEKTHIFERGEQKRLEKNVNEQSKLGKQRTC